MASTSDAQALVLRLAGPLQSWGTRSQFNRRSTDDRPSKSGVVGLLAAALGRRRGESITDLLELSMGVRVDQPGVVMHDYHTVTGLGGQPLLSAKVNGKGEQTGTSPKKYTYLTTRDYLSDAVFTAALGGDPALLRALATAVRSPRFPLSLGRRSCPPSEPLVVVAPTGDDLWAGPVAEVLSAVPWQASDWVQERPGVGATVRVAYTVDAPDGDDTASDVPLTFAHHDRGFGARRVRHGWLSLPTGRADAAPTAAHDPFSLLGW